MHNFQICIMLILMLEKLVIVTTHSQSQNHLKKVNLQKEFRRRRLHVRSLFIQFHQLKSHQSHLKRILNPMYHRCHLLSLIGEVVRIWSKTSGELQLPINLHTNKSTPINIEFRLWNNLSQLRLLIRFKFKFKQIPVKSGPRATWRRWRKYMQKCWKKSLILRPRKLNNHIFHLLDMINNWIPTKGIWDFKNLKITIWNSLMKMISLLQKLSNSKA